MGSFIFISCRGDENGQLDKELFQIMGKYQAIGVSTVVIKDNHVIHSHFYSNSSIYSDTTLRKSIPSNGIYWLASISKTFVSTAIMQLVEKNRLKLDDDVNKYLKFIVVNPKYPDVPITIRMLLCHRSSLNDKQYGWTLNMMCSKNNKKYEQCFNDYKPGTTFAYCNLGYNILGAIIENVSGMRFDEYIDQNICLPLRLNASFNLTNIDSARLVRSYIYDKKKQVFKPSITIYNYDYIKDKLANYQLGLSTACFSPAGGMRMSTMDLAKWTMLHMNYGDYKGKRIISKETELEMWKPQGKDRNYGFAFSRYSKVLPDANLYGMTGGSHGIHSLMFFEPEKKYGFVVICNGCTSKSANGSEMNYEIVRALYKYLIKDDK